MPYTNDMATLADVVSPVDAAMNAGQQEGNANIQDAIKTQIAQQTMPQEIQKASLANALTQAQAYETKGLGMQSVAKGITDINATPSATQAAIAGNQAKVTSAHVDQLQNLGQVVGSLDQQLQGYPDAAKPAVVSQFLNSNGVQDPSIRQLMMNAASQPGGLTQISQSLFNASNKVRETLAEANVKGGYQLAGTSMEVAGREQTAKEQADARRYIADQKAITDRLKQNTDQALAQIVQRLGTPQEQPGDRERATYLQQQSEGLRQQQALANQQLLGIGVPQANINQIPQTGGAPTPNVPQGQGTTPPATAEDAVTAEMRKRGLLK